MAITTDDYALLCSDSYENRSNRNPITLGGVTYKIFDYYSNPVTGYQGTAYQRTDTNEVVIASRGTELGPDVVADVGMVLTGLNGQMSDARNFVARVQRKAEERATTDDVIPSITLTGHSLGGGITEVLAHEFNMQGVTFNAYGAVDLGYRIPEGGTQVTNYVRVTDVVSAASRHFGKVVELATPDDIDQLRHAGYSETITAKDLRNPLGALRLAAHSIKNFAPDNPAMTPSDLSPENEARARAHGQAIGLFRADIHALRANTLSLPWELQQKQQTAKQLAKLAATATLQGDFEHAAQFAELAARRTEEYARHAWNTATNTAMLGITAIDRVGENAANALKETGTELSAGLDRMGRALGSEAVERYVCNTVDDMSQAFEQARGAAARGLEHIKQALPGQHAVPAHHEMEATASVPHSATEPLDTDGFWVRVDRMIAAADAGDWNSFMEDNKVLADTPAAREMWAQAAATVDKEEQRAMQQRQSNPSPLTHTAPFAQMSASMRLDDPLHPDHSLYQQARGAVHRLDAEHDRIPDHRSDQLAAALVVAARRDGLTRIDTITVHRDGENLSAWEKAPPGSDWFTQFQISTRHAEVPIVQSLDTPIEHSSRAWEQTMHQKQVEQAQLELQRQQQPTYQQSHGLSR